MDPYSPDGLAARFEILDRLALYAHAVDRRRWELMEQVFHSDAVCAFASFSGPWLDFIRNAEVMFDRALTYTQHQLGNFQISFEGRQIAHTEIYCTAYHRVRGEAPAGGMLGGTGKVHDVIGGLRYIDRFEFREDRWGITHRHALSDWRHIRNNSEDALQTVIPEFRGGLGQELRSARVIARWLGKRDETNDSSSSGDEPEEARKHGSQDLQNSC